MALFRPRISVHLYRQPHQSGSHFLAFYAKLHGLLIGYTTIQAELIQGNFKTHCDPVPGVKRAINICSVPPFRFWFNIAKDFLFLRLLFPCRMCHERQTVVQCLLNSILSVLISCDFMSKQIQQRQNMSIFNIDMQLALFYFHSLIHSCLFELQFSPSPSHVQVSMALHLHSNCSYTMILYSSNTQKYLNFFQSVFAHTFNKPQ